MRILVLAFMVFLSGCSTVQLKSIPGEEETRILLLARTSEKFDIVHDGYHMFPRFRPLNVATGTPGWTLSDLFFDVAQKKQVESKFRLILGKDHLLPENEDGTIHGGHKELLKELAEKYNAHYILLLNGEKLYNPDFTLWLDSQYGYMHTVTKPLFKFESEGSIYMHVSLYLLSPEKLDNYPIVFKNCSNYNSPRYEKEIEKLSLPDVIKGEFMISSIDEKELALMYDTARMSFESAIGKFFEKCGVIPRDKLDLGSEDKE